MSNIRPYFLFSLIATLGLYAAAYAGPTEVRVPKGYTLFINFTPASCAVDPSKQRLRECTESYNITVSTMRPVLPQHMDEKDCAEPEENDLSPLQEHIVDRVMPDRQIRQEAWRRNGGCSGMTAKNYFRTISANVSRFKTPEEFRLPKESVVSTQRLVQQLSQLNPGLNADGFALHCAMSPKFNNAILTEVRVCYDLQGNYGICPSNVHTNCPGQISIVGSP